MTNQTDQETPETEVADDEPEYYIMAVVEAVYRTATGNVGKRTMNALLQTNDVNVSRHVLDTINTGIIRRLGQENDITPENILDIVFLNICPLGYMTHNMFHGPTPSEHH